MWVQPITRIVPGGAQVTQNYVPRVTHVIAQDANDPFFKARRDKVDMISVEWLLECAAKQALIPLRPHHYMHLTRGTRNNVPNVCKYGDMCGLPTFSLCHLAKFCSSDSLVAASDIVLAIRLKCGLDSASSGISCMAYTVHFRSMSSGRSLTNLKDWSSREAKPEGRGL